MITNELLTYVRESLTNNRSELDIKNELIGHGWLESDVNEAFQKIRPPVPMPSPIIPTAPTASPQTVFPSNEVTGKLQEIFPLSPKKFWKKFISANIGTFIITLLLLAPAIAIEVALSSTNDSDAKIVWLVMVGIVIFMGIIALLRGWYIKVYIRRYYYENEPNYLTIRKGVFTSAEIHVPYHKIQDVYVDQDFLDRLMGLYDVHIASATVGSAIEAHIDGVEKSAAEGLKNMLLARIQGGPVNTVTMANSLQSNIGGNSGKVVLQLDRKITQNEYPIISAWWIGNVLGRLGSSILIALIVVGRASSDGLSNPSIIIPLLALFVVAFLWGIIRLALFVRNYRFEFTPEYLYARYGIFSITETHMPYNTIQDVRIEQSFFNKIFGVYTVAIENAVGGGKALSLVGLSKTSAGAISTLLKNQVLGVHDTSKI